MASTTQTASESQVRIALADLLRNEDQLRRQIVNGSARGLYSRELAGIVLGYLPIIAIELEDQLANFESRS